MNLHPRSKLLHHDEKHIDFDEVDRSARRQPLTLRERLVRIHIPSILLLFAFFLLCRRVYVWKRPSEGFPSYVDYLDEADDDVLKVNLEAHIMSKCPDARDCLQQLVVPVMEQVSDKVQFRLSYIGSLDPQSDDVHCMHGPSECLGNIIQLCAQKIYPDPKLFLGFANCMTSDYPQIPERELVQGCAMEHGLDFDRLNSCISEEGHGTDLLRESIRRSQEKHVTKSCTIRLDGKVRCVRDGGRWYDCPGGSEVSDLVKEIKDRYDWKNLY